MFSTPGGPFHAKRQAPWHRYHSAAATLMLARTAARTPPALGVTVPTIRGQVLSLAVMATATRASNVARASQKGGQNRPPFLIVHLHWGNSVRMVFPMTLFKGRSVRPFRCITDQSCKTKAGRCVRPDSVQLDSSVSGGC